MIIIFEGPDGAGKDFARKALELAGGYQHLCLTRAWLSQLVYAHYYHRLLVLSPVKHLEFYKSWERFAGEHKPLTVLVSAEVQVLQARLQARGEDPSHGPELREQAKLFSSLADVLVPAGLLLRIDTTRDPSKEALKHAITQRIEELGGCHHAQAG